MRKKNFNEKLFLLIIVLFLLSPIFISFENVYLNKIINTKDETFLLKELEKWENSKNADKNLYIGIIIHNLALSGNYKFIDNGIEALSDYYERTHFALALAYKGSLKTLLASVYSKRGLLMDALKLLQEGLDCIDNAIKIEPDNIGLRFLRIESGFEISESSPVKRYEVIKKDLVFLSKRLNQLTYKQQATYYYFLGYYFYIMDDLNKAIKNFEYVCKNYSDTEYTIMAKKILFELEE